MIQAITRQEFEYLLQCPGGEYARTRWNYMRQVIDIINDNTVNTALELGPGPIPVTRQSHVMLNPKEDLTGRPIDRTHVEIVHDATQAPWPIADNAYDLFVALQVWEHLGNHQARAFQEVMRVARMAILSFPLLWDCPKDSHNYSEHHMITENKIADWTLGMTAREIVKVPRLDLTTGRQNGWRIVYFWKFD